MDLTKINPLLLGGMKAVLGLFKTNLVAEAKKVDPAIEKALEVPESIVSVACGFSGADAAVYKQLADDAIKAEEDALVYLLTGVDPRL